MTLEAFSIKWFSIYYAFFGLLLLVTGFYLVFNPARFERYLQHQLKNETPPLLLRRILKYLFLFTIPCLILSFTPFSWTELIFSVWSLLMVYLGGSQLVRWQQLRKIISQKNDSLDELIRKLGVILLSVALVIFLLDYLVIRRLQQI